MLKPADDQDQEIVSSVIAGDYERFGEIMRRYEPRLLRYAVYLIHDEAVAADAVQQTFIKAFQNLNSYKPSYGFSSWIYRIAHNEAMNAIRSESHIDRSVDSSEIEAVLSEPTIMHKIDTAILQKDVQACLRALEPKYREVLMLYYYENMRYVDIADVLHIPSSTVGIWIARGKTRLREICKEQGVRS